MRKFKALFLVTILVLCCMLAGCGKDEKKDGKIKVGVVNNPPSESGYREANVKDMEKVFSEANGYELKTFYSQKNDEQLQAANGFITDGVDYLLISAAETTGWDEVLNLKMLRELGCCSHLFLQQYRQYSDQPVKLHLLTSPLSYHFQQDNCMSCLGHNFSCTLILQMLMPASFQSTGTTVVKYLP